MNDSNSRPVMFELAVITGGVSEDSWQSLRMHRKMYSPAEYRRGNAEH